MNQVKTQAQENIDDIKAAAKRMCALASRKGLRIKHSDMLELIAAGFDIDTFRKLKAVIDAPRATPDSQAAPVLPSKPEEAYKSYGVDGVYSDSGQPYGDDFGGRTPLEAAFVAMMDRRWDHNNSLDVHSVIAADGEKVLIPTVDEPVELQSNLKALQALKEAVTDEAVSEPLVKQALAWLREVLRTFRKEEQLYDLTDSFELRQMRTLTPGVICVGSELSPTGALILLCDTVEARYNSVVDLEVLDYAAACAIHQVRAMCSYFGKYIDSEFAELCNFELAPVAA